ncbi:hypothetical protein [Roseovarius salinarum]|uniref:hypothetical protein n=1 Tax=Roseovarius salinarum TaxID=1981892 RepID=UPI00130005EB|nr:hypothetical protein [Roseovarius salinarum]
MKTRIVLTTLALTFASATAGQACPWHDKHAMSCADGMVYDKDARTCVKVTG